MSALDRALARLGAGAALSAAEAEEAVGALLDGETTPQFSAEFLTTWRANGIAADEIEGTVRAVRARMSGWDCEIASDRLLDTCGTGGDGAGTINISTAAAVVAAACGVQVVKHGNRAATGRVGSSDVLAALGVAIDPEPEVSRRCLAEASLAFLFAPRYHPGLARLAPVRRGLPFRTVFNLIGPLCNPASPGHQLVGVPDDVHAGLLAEALSRQPHIRRAIVVTGSDGLDEITLDGSTIVRLVEPGRVEQTCWAPEDFGLPRQGTETLVVGDAAESAWRLVKILEGELSPARDYVIANTAAALMAATRCTLLEGADRAARAIDTGAALGVLGRYRELAPGIQRSW
jgi:anthranilate phosphoribosyltransferase